MNAPERTVLGSLPLSPEQRALPGVSAACARLSAMEGDGVVDVASDGWRLSLDVIGSVDLARLRDAVERVLGAHQGLRHRLLRVSGRRDLRQAMEEGPLPRWREEGDEDRLDAPNVRAVLNAVGPERTTLTLRLSEWVADRGSLIALAGQIAEAYATSLPPASVFQYDAFVAWRQELADEEDASAIAAYWSDHLAQVIGDQAACLSFRRDRVEAATSGAVDAPTDVAVGSAGAAQSASASCEGRLARRIDEIGTAHGLRAPEVIHAAWWLLLSRLQGWTPFVAGWAHDCRDDYELMLGAVGPYEKLLPLVVDPVAGEGFGAWLDRLAAAKERHAAAQEYWPVDAPTDRRHLAFGASASMWTEAVTGGARWSVREIGSPGDGASLGTELAVHVDWRRHGGQGDLDAVLISVRASSSHYSAADAQRLCEQLLALLEDASARPETPVEALEFMPAARRAELLADPAPLDVGTATVATRTAQWAERTPHAPALEDGDRRLSHRELDDEVLRLARRLRASGVARGDIVALALPRSASLVVAMLAAWRAGAAYLPLDPQWPIARRQAVLDDARPRVVLRGREGEEGDGDVIDIERLGEEPGAGASDPAPFEPGRSSDAAYLLYTSGSTGTPKGVVIEHGALLNYVAAASAAMGLEACRRWALTSTVAADLGNTALFGALFNGACLVIASSRDSQDPEAFSRFMRMREIDALKIVPSHLEALLDADQPSLPRCLVLGGEAAPRALIERLRRIAPHCDIHNHYGPTETTVGVMVHAVRRPEAGDAAPPAVLPLSTVLANNRVRVLDAAMRPVPVGAMGEVWIGGAQLCRGYLNRPGEVVVDDPFHAGGRLYRTGDLAWLLPQGGLRLAGRADDQLKIRGHRIEPGEVEAALLSHAQVRQAVVLARAGSSGPELTAIVVPEHGADEAALEPALRAHLTARLPEPMRPSRYRFMVELPRLGNGKVDRLALAGQVATTSTTSTTEAAVNPVENIAGHASASGNADEGANKGATVTAVAGAGAGAADDSLAGRIAVHMGELLDRAPLGVDDDFFDHGGHSLLVIRLVARLRKLLAVEVAHALVFDHPTPSALAAALHAEFPSLPSLSSLDASSATGHPR
ncbi:amino acid adenylation domain-containing protein [Roseateles sp.]|uniref:non-ribosomal peptide synthetase family protein n=1 Tax=Roseateles sp. TaxID=1971397 RepID=UPI0039E89B24